MPGFGIQHADAAERKRQQRARDRAIVRRQCADPKRRIRLEKDTPKWLRHYMGARAFPAPFSDGHLEIIDNAERSALDGTGAAAAAPRGEGKTTILRGVAVSLVARRMVRFPVLAGWIKSQADEAFACWLRMVSESPEFAADYPEICQPFEVSIHNHALRNLTWADTGEKIGAALRSVHKVMILPDSIGAIAARSVQSDAKGLNVTLPDGTVLRPDLLLLDDAQDVAQADNAVAVAKTVDVIENVFMGLAGPQTRLTTFAACTIEAEGDVSCHLLKRPGFRSVITSRIATWPGGESGGDWPAKKDDAQRVAWDEWRRVLLDEGQRKANTYYRKRRKMMIDGMRVSWIHRYDKTRDVDAYDAAMRDYYDKGPDVFSRAQQNNPITHESTVYDLTPALIQSRTSECEPQELPPWAKVVVVASDLNHYGIHTESVGMGNDQTAAVLWYGRYDCDGHGIVAPNEPESEAKRAMFEALVAHGLQLRDLRNRPGLWVIDAGYMPDVVARYIQQHGARLGFPVQAMRGYSADKYRPFGKNVIGKPGEQWHRTESTVAGRFIAANMDYWREVGQRAWLGSIDAPGSVSLYRGHHREFAEQASRERLREKLYGAMGPVWRWTAAPGWRDWGDTHTMCYVAASVCGIGTGGAVRGPAKKNNRRRGGVEVISI